MPIEPFHLALQGPPGDQVVRLDIREVVAAQQRLSASYDASVRFPSRCGPRAAVVGPAGPVRAWNGGRLASGCVNEVGVTYGPC